MALNFLPYRILGSDKLRSGFRAKYNLQLNKLIKDWRVSDEDADRGTLYLITQDNTEVPLDLSGVYYTKEVIDELFAVKLATEEEAGIIRIATEEDALLGDSDNSVITPYKLWLVLNYFNGRPVIAGEDLGPGEMVYLELIDVEPDPEEEEPLFPILKAFKADASDASKSAVGFVDVEAGAGEETFIKYSGNISTYNIDLLPNQHYYLSEETPGGITPVPTKTPGGIQQIVGYAISELELMVEIHKPFLNWTPVFEDFPTFYFAKGKYTAWGFDMKPLLAPYNKEFVETPEGETPPDEPEIKSPGFSYRFLGLPGWVYVHTVIFDGVSLGGAPDEEGTYKAFLEISDKDNRTFLQEITLEVGPEYNQKYTLIDSLTNDEVGEIPGAYEVVDQFKVQANTTGRVDKIISSIYFEDDLLITTEIEVDPDSDTSSELLFGPANITGQVGQWRIETESFLGDLSVESSVVYFTLYDEEYLGKIKAFLSTNTAEVGEITLGGPNSFLFNPDIKKAVIKYEDIVHTSFEADHVFEGVIVDTITIPYDVDNEDSFYELPFAQELAEGDSHEVRVRFKDGTSVIEKRTFRFSVGPEPVEETDGLDMMTYASGTSNLSLVSPLPKTLGIVETPSNYTIARVDDSNAPVTFAEWRYYRLQNGTYVEMNLSPYTGLPSVQYFSTPKVNATYLLFGSKNSTQIPNAHEINGTYLAILTLRTEEGLLGIYRGEFTLREKLDPSDESGLELYHFNNETSGETIVDTNMPIVGAVYYIPAIPLYWNVRFKGFGPGKTFDELHMYFLRNGEYMTTATGTDIFWLKTYVTPTDDISSSPIYTYGLVQMNGKRRLSRPEGGTIIIDEPDVFEVRVVGLLEDVELYEVSSTFNMKEMDTEPPIDECCSNYEEFSFTTPSTEWIVEHELGKYPLAQVYVGGRLIIADIRAIDSSSFRVVHNKPKTGSVIITT